MGGGEEERRGTEEGKILYYVKIKSIFNKRKKKK